MSRPAADQGDHRDDCIELLFLRENNTRLRLIYTIVVADEVIKCPDTVGRCGEELYLGKVERVESNIFLKTIRTSAWNGIGIFRPASYSTPGDSYHSS